jgi:hypothetical protein
MHAPRGAANPIAHSIEHHEPLAALVVLRAAVADRDRFDILRRRA